MTFCPKSVIYWVTLFLSIDISFTVNLMLKFRPGRFQNKILWSFIAENPKYVQTLLNISHRRFTLIYVLHWKNLNFVWLRFQLPAPSLPITTIIWRYFNDLITPSHNTSMIVIEKLSISAYHIVYMTKHKLKDPLLSIIFIRGMQWSNISVIFIQTFYKNCHSWNI